jgi:hypothetical protein
MNDAEVLHAAADLIERNGIHKGEFWPGYKNFGSNYVAGDPVCARGAFTVAMNCRGFDCTVGISKTLARFALDENATILDLVKWNDSRTTTAELMAKTMRACADELDASSG